MVDNQSQNDLMDEIIAIEKQARAEAISEARAHFDKNQGAEKGSEDGFLFGGEIGYYRGFCEQPLEDLLPSQAKHACPK